MTGFQSHTLNKSILETPLAVGRKLMAKGVFCILVNRFLVCP